MGNRELALSRVAGMHSCPEFFDEIVEVLAQGLRARLVIIGTKNRDTDDISVLACHAADGPSPSDHYPVAGTPCQTLYERPPATEPLFVPEAVGADFSAAGFLSEKTDQTYLGAAFHDPSGNPIGHVFAVGAGAGPLEPETEAFFRLVCRRIGAEYSRIRTQKRLQANQQRYDLAVSQAGVWDWDLANDTVYFSPRFNEMLGFGRPKFDQLARNFLMHLVHPDDRTRYQEELAKHLRDPNSSYDAELRLLTQNSGYRWFHARGQSLIGPDGRSMRFAGIVTDIQDRKRAEEQLRESQRRLSEAHRMAGVGSWVAFPNADAMEWHESAGTLFADLDQREITIDEFLGRVHNDDRISVQIAMDHCLRRGIAFDLVHRFRTPDGGTRWLHQHAEPELDPSGRVACVKGSTVDVSKLKKAEEGLRRAKEEAEYANRAKSEFLANMSHELRTPLNAVIGFGSLLSQEVYGTHSDTRYREYAEDICDSGQHLLDLINDILDVARIEAGSMELEEYELDLKGINVTCLKLVGGRATKANLSISTVVEPEDLRLYGDGRRVKQILINLLSNSVKFTPAGGSILVRWRLDGERTVLDVIDTGVGIDEKVLPRLFEPFSRGEDSLTREYEGTGLGLSLVRKLALLHEGEVTVKSKPGRRHHGHGLFPGAADDPAERGFGLGGGGIAVLSGPAAP